MPQGRSYVTALVSVLYDLPQLPRSKNRGLGSASTWPRVSVFWDACKHLLLEAEDNSKLRQSGMNAADSMLSSPAYALTPPHVVVVVGEEPSTT
eukprot:5388231-Amphidinium_carterae.1